MQVFTTLSSDFSLRWKASSLPNTEVKPYRTSSLSAKILSIAYHGS